MANSSSLRSLGQQEIGKLKWQTLVVSANWDTDKLAKSNRKLSQSLLFGTPRNWLSLTMNSRSLCTLGHREIGKVKWQTLSVPAHWDKEKLANSRILRSLGHGEIGKVKQ